MADPTCGTALTAYIGAGAALLGAIIGAGASLIPAWWQKKRRHKAFWAAMSAEVELCHISAQGYLVNAVQSPLARLPTVAYTAGFAGLLADGAVSHDEAAAILAFYGVVEQFNRGADQANAAKLDPRGDVLLWEEGERLQLKAKHIADPEGSFYKNIRTAIDRHVPLPST